MSGGGAAAGKAGGTRVIIIKKKGGHGGHHGGAWKVAYADFVTAMMALFMVMWLLSQTDQETRQELSEYFRTGMFSGATAITQGGSGLLERGYLDVKDLEPVVPRDDPGFKMAVRQIEKAIERAAEELHETGLGERVQVSITPEGLLIQLIDGGDDLLFDVSSSKLKPGANELLQSLGPILGKLPNQLEIHGHTDARMFPKSSGRNNWELSFNRADSARDVLEQAGLREGQVRGVFAHGSTRPYNATDPLAPENRRISILAVRQPGEETKAIPNPLGDPAPKRRRR